MTIKVTYKDNGYGHYGVEKRSSCMDMAEAASFVWNLVNVHGDASDIRIDGVRFGEMPKNWMADALKASTIYK